MSRSPPDAAPVALGLAANWRQFTLLVVVNAFVGAMVGLERAVLPLLAVESFQVASTTAVLSFIAAFGLAKALTNLGAGWLAGRGIRRTALLLGWCLAIPVPLLILWAPSWGWIVFANALLGMNQGLTWSMTVIMKIDLAGPRQRGLAMGLNEFAGYLAVAGAAAVSGVWASSYGLREGAAYPGLVIVAIGLLLSLFVRETGAHVQLEATGVTADAEKPTLWMILKRSTWSDAPLFSVSQAGLVNNLNDGLAWGLFPILFVTSGMSLQEMSLLAAIYPAVWGMGQLFTGPLSDRWGRKPFIVGGMLLQGAALISIPLLEGFGPWAGSLIALGFGTAMAYPTLLAAIGDIAHPSWRGEAVGVYRLWRDLGYVVGAILAGTLADSMGIPAAVTVIGALTCASGAMVAVRLPAGAERR